MTKMKQFAAEGAVSQTANRMQESKAEGDNLKI